jgi:hypothetical protein
MEGIKIVVLDRGFVKVGALEKHPDLAFHWRLRGRTIRRWGTTEGHIELCDGPTKDTVLDSVPSTKSATSAIPFRAVIEILDCTEEGEEKWKKLL